MHLPEFCIDYRGRTIEFPDGARRHILRRHPDIHPFLPRICEVLSGPDVVLTRPGANTHIYAKLGICSDDYFVVYVKYNDTERAVTTAYSTAYLPSRLFRIHPR